MVDHTMPNMPQRPSARQPAKKEPSYQIGVPIDGGGDALQPGDSYDQEETAQEHPAPSRDMHTSTEVSLPEDLPTEEPPSSRVVPSVPVRAAATASARGRSGRASKVGSTSVTDKAVSARQPAAANKSSRSARSTATAATSTAAPRVSSRRMSFDKAGFQKAVLWIGIGLLIAVVAITSIILLATHGSENRRLATEALGEATRQQDLAKNALASRRGTEARKAYDAALAALTGTAQLGGAVAAPPEGKPVVKDLAIQAFDLRTEIETLKERIAAVQAENAAAANLSALTARFATLGEPATDLDQLEKDVLAYVDNPVEPKAGASPNMAATHARMVTEAKLRLASIATERERRKSARSLAPLRLAEVETDGLIQQEQFGAALDKLEKLGRENPDADFSPLRGKVEDSAAKSWRSAKAQVDTKLADWKSRGATEGQRQAALATAKERLNQVIQRFGLPTYVDQARAMLTPLP